MQHSVNRDRKKRNRLARDSPRVNLAKERRAKDSDAVQSNTPLTGALR